jgi:hypothetical protein
MDSKYRRPIELPWAAKEREISEYYAAHEMKDPYCGSQELGWMVDAYWGLVTKQRILPACAEIHKALVAGGFSETNKHDYNDLDCKVYYIDARHRVFAQSGQNYSFLFILKDAETDWPEFHIRQFWGRWDKEAYLPKGLLESVENAIAHVPTLEKFADDHYTYSHRWSLEKYRAINFSIRGNGTHTYGDFRDSGYVLSYYGAQPKPSVEGSLKSFGLLSYTQRVIEGLQHELGAFAEEGQNDE